MATLWNRAGHYIVVLWFLLSNILYLSVCMFVFVNRSVVERLRPHIFTDFHELLHTAQKCCRFDAYYLWDKPEIVCRFRQFSGSGDHIFQQISTIPYTAKIQQCRLCIHNGDLWNRKYKSDYRAVQIPYSVSICVLWYDYVRNSL